MNQPKLLSCYQHPALLSILPLLYVAWADGDLSADELELIRARVSRLSLLDGQCQLAIESWLDPSQPPGPTDLHQLLFAIRKRALDLPKVHRLSLIDLGIRIATVDHPSLQLDPEEIEALSQLTDELGLGGPEISALLLGLEPPSAAHEQEPSTAEDLSDLADRLQRPFPNIRRQIFDHLLDSESTPPNDLRREQYRAWVTAQVSALGERGYGALSAPSALGGADSAGSFVTAFETLAFGDLSVLVKFGVQFGLFAGAIQQLGNDQQHQKYLADATTMKLPGCFAMTETGHGSNVQGLETTATFDPQHDGFVIHTPHPQARKDYIGNAARDARLAVVFAQLHVGENNFGVHAFLVAIRSADGSAKPGVSISDCDSKLGLNGVDNGRLSFDQVWIERDALLNRFGGVDDSGVYQSSIPSDNKRFFTTLGALVGGRVSVALASMSVAKTSLAIAIGYGNRRRQFGSAEGPEVPILDYPSHQLRLMPLLAKTFGLHFALRRLADDFVSVEEPQRRELESDAAGLKVYATWHATDAVQICRESCGGQGYLAINRFADLKADSDVFTTFEGDNTVLMQLVAKSMLTGYRKQFSDLNSIGLARFLVERAAERVAELNPVVVRNTDPEHLRNPGFHAFALRYREDHVLSTVATRLRRRIKAGESLNDAFLACQVHLIAAAKAHVERRILQALHGALDQPLEASSATALNLLSTLLGVHFLANDRAWFQEHSLLGSSKAKALQRQHETLSAQLRPLAQSLVDAWGIPAGLLPAIATSQSNS